MKLINFEKKLFFEKSEDCKIFLEKYYNIKNWKRVFKCTDDVRIFSNGHILILLDNCSMIENCENTIIDEIKQIKNCVKNYYSFGYGEVYYNPKEKKLYINVGDGGYFYSKTKINVNNLDEDKIDDILIKMENDVANNIEVENIDLPFIKNVTFEAECSPISCGLDGYFHIANLNII